MSKRGILQKQRERQAKEEKRMREAGECVDRYPDPEPKEGVFTVDHLRRTSGE